MKGRVKEKGKVCMSIAHVVRVMLKFLACTDIEKKSLLTFFTPAFPELVFMNQILAISVKCLQKLLSKEC